MKSFVFTTIIFLFTNVLTISAFFSSGTVNVTTAVRYINTIAGLTWKAGFNGFENTLQISDLISKFVSVRPKNEEYLADSMVGTDGQVSEEDDLPINYDTRTAYPYCTTISSIKDQSNCGSCWAVSTAAAFSDRLCIQSGGKINVNVSAEQLVACDIRGFGCIGGSTAAAWIYIRKHGLVTGGDFGSNEGCWPYSFAPSGILGSLFEPNPLTPDCREVECQDVYKAKGYKMYNNKEYEIRREIYQNGPVTAWFDLYLSILFYKEGIYQPLYFDYLIGSLGHAIRIIGWGEEDGVKYWIVANSWSRAWGDNGTFKILRGVKCCHIETYVVAGKL